MEKTEKLYAASLGRKLIRDELFDLLLYKKLRERAHIAHAVVLDKLIKVEEGHFLFWREFFEIEVDDLDIGRKMKLSLLVLFCDLFGKTGVHLVLQSIEVYGIRKYLRVWEAYKDDPLGEAVREVLLDEFQHEEDIVQLVTGKHIFPERVRDIFLGFNDGLVEVIGAVAGFFAAFGTATSVLVAGFTVAIAGAISMAASVYAAMGSEQEIAHTQREKERFLGKEGENGEDVHPLNSSFVVGVSYFLGAMVPLLPVFFGAQNVFLSVLISTFVIVLVSTVLAFISGMAVAKRIVTNLIVIAIAVGVAYAIGSVVKEIFNISL